MAKGGSPDGKDSIDWEVAAAYLHLWGDDKSDFTATLRRLGIQEINLPEYKSLPYGATAIHRRKDWAAIIKGYSKYVWSSEIYANSNRYGRYPANGTVQLLSEGGEEGSGFVQEGWDWNRFPGATIIYFPLEELETDRALLMFLSQESFAGATYMDGNGVFGMKLNESKGRNADGLVADNEVAFPGKLKAFKSVFSFGDKLVCIGTGISSEDKDHPVQTNLFQTALTKEHQTLKIPRKQLDDFPIEGNTYSWIIDPYGNGYHILNGQSIHFKKEKQQSYHNKYSINTGALHGPPWGNGTKSTEGEFATAWLDHGLEPEEASYQYVIYPFLAEKEQLEFARRISNKPDFKVLRADKAAHIVKDMTSLTTAYVIFDADAVLQEGVLHKVSAPSLFMVKEERGRYLKISGVNPDLNFPENPKKKNGYNNFSRPVPLHLTIEGRWELEEGEAVVNWDGQSETTVIKLECVDGFPQNLTLKKN
ncbi:hypothetical protein GCM10028791_21590 [Echinicola sediminis]